MRIAIDARMMSPLQARGIGRYTEETVRAMINVGSPHTFVLLMKNPETSPFLGLPYVEHIAANIHWYGVAEQTRMPRKFVEARADLIHAPHFNVPLFMPHKPLVVTVHDLLLRHQPLSAKATTKHPAILGLKHLGFRAVLNQALHHASAVVVPTEFVAQDVKNFYPFVAKRVFVTGEGLTDLPEPDIRRVPSKPFLFYVGSAYPHKRLDLLLDVWAEFAPTHPELELVIAGEEDVFMARYVARVHKGSMPRVTFTGRITDQELAGFLDHATGMVFPSSHEGFGLPPLEALAHECPVVSSDATSLPEVLPKQGVFFFRNGDKNGMMRALDQLLRDPATAKQEARKAIEEIRLRHDWKRVAERTIEVYERCVNH